MGKPTAHAYHREALISRRALLLESTGMTEEVLFRRAAAYELYPEHRSAYESIQSIDWLLGEEPLL